MVSPRGHISHDQLSVILLGYVSDAADIIGLLDTFTHSITNYTPQIAYLVLSSFTLSVYRFVFVLVERETNYDNFDRYDDYNDYQHTPNDANMINS